MLFILIMWLILVALLLYKNSKNNPSLLINCAVVFIGYLLIFEAIALIEKQPFTFLWIFLIAIVVSIAIIIIKRITNYIQPSNKVNM